MNAKAIFYSIFLLFSIALGSWYAIENAEKAFEQPQGKKQVPDFFMTNVAYIQTDETGYLRDYIITPKISHVPDQDSYIFTDPLVKMTDNNKQFWNITSRFGKAKQGGKEVFLWDDVKVAQEERNLLITTSVLSIFPQQKLANTDQSVVIKEGENTVQAVGATVDFQAGTVKLLSKVRGQYNASTTESKKN